MRLHLLTAITRPDNVPAIADSVDAARRPGLELIWHMRQDKARQHVGGQALKNAMLDGIGDGWVSILDDDNLLHAELPATVAALQAPHVDLIVVGQQLPGGGYRPARLGCLRVDQVDAAQLVIRRSALGALRLPETYAGDGLLAETLAETLEPGRILYHDAPLSFYNRLLWGDQ